MSDLLLKKKTRNIKHTRTLVAGQIELIFFLSIVLSFEFEIK